MQEADWQAEGTATNALATATKAAQVGTRHRITFVSASYSAAQIGLLTIKVNAVAVWNRYIHNAADIDLSGAPIRGGANQAVTAELSAGGAAVVGYVELNGQSVG